MLVLDRNEGERILLGEDIVIEIVRSRGPVKIGITAPKDVKVLREELQERKESE